MDIGGAGKLKMRNDVQSTMHNKILQDQIDTDDNSLQSTNTESVA